MYIMIFTLVQVPVLVLILMGFIDGMVLAAIKAGMLYYVLDIRIASDVGFVKTAGVQDGAICKDSLK
jgi:hypothetical protein